MTKREINATVNLSSCLQYSHVKRLAEGFCPKYIVIIIVANPNEYSPLAGALPHHLNRSNRLFVLLVRAASIPLLPLGA